MYTREQETESRELLYFIVNPASHSGKGVQLWKQVAHVLKERRIPCEVFFSQKQGDAAAIAERLTASLEDGEERLLIALGGDGTVNEVMQGICDFDRVKFGYIPTGSSNDLARDMGIGRNACQALEVILGGGKEQRMDVGCVSWKENGILKRRRFLVSCGMGYDAAVCEEALSSKIKDILNRIGLGKLTYLGIGLKQMMAARYVKAVIRLDGEETIHLDKMLFIANMSHRYEGGGFCFCPQADAQDGLLDLCVVNQVPRWKFPVIIPFALKGKHFRFAGVTHYRSARIDIKTSAPLWVQTDGEIPGRLDRITVTVEKQKLRIISAGDLTQGGVSNRN